MAWVAQFCKIIARLPIPFSLSLSKGGSFFINAIAKMRVAPAKAGVVVGIKRC
jgi:hypothetical protein